MDSKFYKDDFFPTSIEEVEYVRSPYYDLARSTVMGGEDDVHDTLDAIGLKFSALSPVAASVLIPAKETPESVAFTRYADQVMADKSEQHIFQFPRGERLRRSVGGELFKVQKDREHWTEVRRSKSYIADDFLPPF